MHVVSNVIWKIEQEKKNRIKETYMMVWYNQILEYKKSSIIESIGTYKVVS